MKYKLSGSTKIPKAKAATFNFKTFESDSLDETIKFLNTHAVVPCRLRGGHRRSENIEEIYPWIRLDIDVEGESKIVDAALKDLMYIKKPSTSHDKNPYKWHYYIPVDGTFQSYESYKQIYMRFLEEFGLDIKDTSLKSIVQNTNPYGLKGTEITEVNSGKMWVVPESPGKGETQKNNMSKRRHSNISKKEIKKALKQIDPKDFDTREKWMPVIAAIYNTFGSDKGRKIAIDWSMGDPSAFEQDGFENLWSQLEDGQYGEKVDPTMLFNLAYPDSIDPMAGFKASAKKKKKSTLKIIDKKEKKKAKAELLDQEMEAIEREKGEIEYDPRLFPAGIRSYMQESASDLGLNFSATVPYTMMMLSQLIGDRVQIRMAKPWLHTPIIWGLNIAGAGVGKSPLTKKLSFPLWDIQKKRIKKHDRDMKDYKYDIHTFQQELKKGDATPEDEPEKPQLEMIVMDEFTVESLYDQLESDSGIMVWKDELKSLFIQNEKTDLLRTKLISAWSGQSIIRNTKGNGANVLTDPFVRVGGNVQPEVVKKILSDNKSGFNADGFIVRFQLIAHLKKIKTVWGDTEEYDTDAFARERYETACKKLLKGKSKVLQLRGESDLILRKYMRSVEDDIKDASSQFEQEFISKIGSLLGSLIVILHELSHDKKETLVTPEIVKAAITITETARDNATHLYGTEKREEVEAEIAENVIEQWLESDTGIKHLGKKGQAMSASDIAKDYLNKKVTTQQAVEYFEESSKYNVLKIGRGHKIVKI